MGRHDTLQTLVSLLGVHRCGSPQAEACFYMRYCEHVFCGCEMCVVSSFFSFAAFIGCVVPSFFFHTGLQVACSERDEPSELLPVERCRSPELRVVHFRDVEL